MRWVQHRSLASVTVSAARSNSRSGSHWAFRAPTSPWGWLFVPCRSAPPGADLTRRRRTVGRREGRCHWRNRHRRPVRGASAGARPCQKAPRRTVVDVTAPDQSASPKGHVRPAPEPDQPTAERLDSAAFVNQMHIWSGGLQFRGRRRVAGSPVSRPSVPPDAIPRVPQRSTGSTPCRPSVHGDPGPRRAAPEPAFAIPRWRSGREEHHGIGAPRRRDGVWPDPRGHS